MVRVVQLECQSVTTSQAAARNTLGRSLEQESTYHHPRTARGLLDGGLVDLLGTPASQSSEECKCFVCKLICGFVDLLGISTSQDPGNCYWTWIFVCAFYRVSITI